MPNVEVVIKIPEETYQGIINADKVICGRWENNLSGILCAAIANGTQLPKGHGDLIDRDKIISDGINKGFCDWYDEIKYAPTIIEADNKESEEKE